MKRTGAKNYRYTDVHWQSVPTRARFLCFGSNTPGRQFRENSRERARRSPGIDVQESDPPLPFAWQSAKADLAAGTSPRRSAKADLATGTSPRRSAKADLATGTSPRRSAKADLAAGTSPRRSAKADPAAGTSSRRSAKADPAAGTSPRRSAKADPAAGTSPRRSAKAPGPGGGLPAGFYGPGRQPSGRARGAWVGRRKKAFLLCACGGFGVLRVSQTTKKLRRLLSCFFGRKEGRM